MQRQIDIVYHITSMMILQAIFFALTLLVLLFFLVLQFKHLKFRSSLLKPFPVLLFSMLLASIFLYTALATPSSTPNVWPLSTIATLNTPNQIEFVSVHDNQLYIIDHSFTGQSNINIFPIPSKNNIKFSFTEPIVAKTHSDILHSFLAAENAVYYIKEKPANMFSIHKKDSLFTDKETLVFQNITVEGRKLAFNDKVHDNDNNIFYVSAENTPSILKINPHKNSIDLFTTFGPNPSDRFFQPRGILFHNQLLYVCDKYRVLAFKNDHLVRVYEPVIMPLHVTVWRTYVVIAAIDRTYFFDHHSAKHLYTHILPSIDITSSTHYLYIAGQNQVQVYQ